MIRILTAALFLAASPALAGHEAEPAHDDGAHAHKGKHKADHDQTPAIVKVSATTEANAKIAEAIAAGGELIVTDVLGVVCDFCATALNKTFAKQKEVAATYVDLDTKTLSIVTKPGETLDDATITKLVVKAGYKVAAIRRGDAALATPAEEQGQ